MLHSFGFIHIDVHENDKTIHCILFIRSSLIVSPFVAVTFSIYGYIVLKSHFMIVKYHIILSCLNIPTYC